MLFHDSYPDVRPFHSPLRGHFPSQWLPTAALPAGVTAVGWRAKVEDRQEWNRVVEQTETHRGLWSE